jgi:tetratricopeptide (TPR) repeat protein
VKPEASALARHRTWARRARKFLYQGERERVLECYQRALEAARCCGDPALEERAFCDVSGALIELGRYKEAEKGLREIVLRSRDPRAIWQATFNLAITLRRQGALERSCHFARRAIEAARNLRVGRFMARSLNLLGNLHLIESRFDQSLACYRRALRLYAGCPGDWRYSVSVIRDNVGYCLLLMSRYAEGLREIEAALRSARDIAQPRVEAECLQDRCYGLLRLRRLEEAQESGGGALALAERHQYRDLMVNCYYLMGEIQHLRGDEAARDRYFMKLQGMYPHLPFLRDFLCAFDVSGIINLKSL